MHVQAFPNKPTKRLNVYPLPHDVVVGAAAGGQLSCVVGGYLQDGAPSSMELLPDGDVDVASEGAGGGQPSIMPATTCSPQLSTKPVDWHTMCTSCAVGTKLALSLVAIAEHGLLMGVCNVVVNDKPRRLTMPVCILEGLRNMPLQSFQEDVHTWTVPPRWSIRFRASGLLQATVCPR